MEHRYTGHRCHRGHASCRSRGGLGQRRETISVRKIKNRESIGVAFGEEPFTTTDIRERLEGEADSHDVVVRSGVV